MTREIFNFLSIENKLVSTYIFYCCILILKMMAVMLLTALQRHRYMAFINPEDADYLNVKPKIDDHVERVRRAHLNDLESIPIFFVAGFAYILTNPSVTCATWLFRIFTAVRFIHTFVYAVYVLPQPARVLSFSIGALITSYMTFKSILYLM
ncbi:hypothetical protein ILUMI_24566 [Ignelater luminosus]|uniref:Microsomal glutathione S-transferase 1 n=1 Tax=Ignelater luminosus TaxID=2038154 RepID=A0A8K0G0S8_IGNLU|nr:hypothetical protein ILUMI_24566 [Ignelater luminosus]